jgi:hypothetical protein
LKEVVEGVAVVVSFVVLRVVDTAAVAVRVDIVGEVLVVGMDYIVEVVVGIEEVVLVVGIAAYIVLAFDIGAEVVKYDLLHNEDWEVAEKML